MGREQQEEEDLGSILGVIFLVAIYIAWCFYTNKNGINDIATEYLKSENVSCYSFDGSVLAFAYKPKLIMESNLNSRLEIFNSEKYYFFQNLEYSRSDYFHNSYVLSSPDHNVSLVLINDSHNAYIKLYNKYVPLICTESDHVNTTSKLSFKNFHSYKRSISEFFDKITKALIAF